MPCPLTLNSPSENVTKNLQIFLSLFVLFFFGLSPPNLAILSKNTRNMRKNIRFSCPTPPYSREISHQKRKKSFCQPRFLLLFFFGGEILHMPASGLGEISTV
jgi:hypothetical protein